MRLPKKGEEFDAALINRMVDVFIDNGYSYFDTAYIYPGSEEALKESVVKRYPREMYKIATKLPIYPLDSPEKIKEIFNTSISRLGVEYIDYYLIHGIDMKQCEKAEILGAWSFISSLKEKGIVKHIGFSFLGTPEELEAILLRHPKAEFVQLQINYFDWDNDRVQSGRLYEIAVKFGKPIVIMEPVKGGLLSSKTSPIAEILKKANPEASIASWAIRFAASLDGVAVVLSGMSNMDQILDNINTVNNLEPLSDEELSVVLEVVDVLNKIPRVPCTECGYCLTSCPQNIYISKLIGLYNDYLVHNTIENTAAMYRFFTDNVRNASICVSCYSCEKHCPQHIEIADTMAKISAVFDKE